MAYQIKRIEVLKGKRKGLDVLVDLGFRSKKLYFKDQKTFDLEFPERMAKAELHVQTDLDQEAYDKLHPTYYTRTDFERMLVLRNMLTPTQTIEDLPTKSAIWTNMTDYSTSTTLAIWNKIFGTTLGQATIEPVGSDM